MALGATASTSPDGLRLAGTLVLLVRTLDQRVRSAAHPDALSIADLNVLHKIERGVDSPSAVARALRLDPARMTHITDRLVTRGYVERTLHQGDRRCWRLRLTESGKERLLQGEANVVEAVESLLGGLSPDERAELAHVLQSVRRVLDAAPEVAQ